MSIIVNSITIPTLNALSNQLNSPEYPKSAAIDFIHFFLEVFRTQINLNQVFHHKLSQSN
jgi:hypothetical protein